MYTIHTALTRHNTPLKVAVVGVGGTGSEVMTGLLNIHHSLKAMNRAGLSVHAFDPDTVSPANLVRQRFSPADLNLNKARVLVRRINAATGTRWEAHERKFAAMDANAGWDLVLSCVDTRAARAELHRFAFSCRKTWKGWLDFGNEKDYGQVIYGEPSHARTKIKRLRCATEIHPEIMDTTLPDDDRPSCSAIEALSRQDLFVNGHGADLGLHVLWKALQTGSLKFQGYYFNLDTGLSMGIPLPSWNTPASRRTAKSTLALAGD